MFSQNIISCAFDIKNSSNYETCEDEIKSIKSTSFDTIREVRPAESILSGDLLVSENSQTRIS